jgi:membrane protease YdiL (CAAX protease family)
VNPPDRPPPRTWPTDRVLADDECVGLACAGCGQPWRVLASVGGFRLRCACGAWLEVPAPPRAADTALLADGATASSSQAVARPVALRGSRAARDEHGRIELPGDDGDVFDPPVPIDAPMAPGTLRRSSAANRVRWTNRTLLEFVLLLAALLGPQVAAMALSRGGEFELLLPFASFASGVLVAGVVLLTGPFGRMGLCRAEPRFWPEAIAAAAIGVVVALGFEAVAQSLLPDLDDPFDALLRRLGPVASLFVIAVTPAVLEEIVFRGMLQGRLLALLGARTGWIVTAAVFALAHGASPALPLLFGIGLYLGWLRERSGSLLPGMLMHFCYNGALVLIAAPG